ncbi:MAG: hypothetical protein RSC68_05135 [Acinetobacter sp.]
MSEEVVGTIVMSVNGEDYDCASFESQRATGHKLVPTMNRDRRNRKRSKGNRTISWSASVVIPNGKDTVAWAEIEDARISIESPDGNFRETFIDCFVQEVSDAYSVEGETRRNLSGFAMDHLEENL